VGIRASLPDLLRLHRLPEPVREYRFHPLRKWAFDLCYPEHRLAVEIEGGVYVLGRHVRPKGYRNDCEKYSEAAVLGWRIIRVTPDMVESGLAVDLIRRALAAAKGGPDRG
jgi:very-short-patch-repair endonuclease